MVVLQPNDIKIGKNQKKMMLFQPYHFKISKKIPFMVKLVESATAKLVKIISKSLKIRKSLRNTLFSSQHTIRSKKRECFSVASLSSLDLTQTHYDRLERLAKDKHSSLLQKSVNYSRKKLYSTVP